MAHKLLEVCSGVAGLPAAWDHFKKVLVRIWETGVLQHLALKEDHSVDDDDDMVLPHRDMRDAYADPDSDHRLLSMKIFFDVSRDIFAPLPSAPGTPPGAPLEIPHDMPRCPPQSLSIQPQTFIDS